MRWRRRPTTDILKKGWPTTALWRSILRVMVRRAHSRRYKHKNEPQLQRAEATNETQWKLSEQTTASRTRRSQ